ncbi:hypothetical protein S1OALGB6SA_478 [Olavius algarvensis spirochete endosymbiont]|nr:hypothetical protein S1OALGB6SA_478 [Olavius algarvensis spirochete endosymbiont]
MLYTNHLRKAQFLGAQNNPLIAGCFGSGFFQLRFAEDMRANWLPIELWLG